MAAGADTGGGSCHWMVEDPDQADAQTTNVNPLSPYNTSLSHAGGAAALLLHGWAIRRRPEGDGVGCCRSAARGWWPGTISSSARCSCFWENLSCSLRSHDVDPYTGLLPSDKDDEPSASARGNGAKSHDSRPSPLRRTSASYRLPIFQAQHRTQHTFNIEEGES